MSFLYGNGSARKKDGVDGAGEIEVQMLLLFKTVEFVR
jgi:hypothetical protein